MQNFTLNNSKNKLAEKDVYHISKRLFWFILLGFLSVVIVLIVLVIYFGVKQNIRNHTIDNIPKLSNNTSLPPLTRISDGLLQLSYHLIITPNLINKTFQGDLLYTFECLNDTNQIVLHVESLIIDNSSIRIVNSSTNSIPIFQLSTYDSYNQFIKFNFSSMLKSKTIYTVRIIYTGIINKELSGLYLNYYVDMNGNKSMFMTSGMEPMNARSMLPCIDEPARKAIFQISVVHDPSYTPWSNGEIQRIESLNDGRLLSHFSPTLPMSTYLLAFILAPKSDFSCLPDHVIGSKNTKSRVCGRVQILPQLTYADEIASKTLEFFNRYFNIDYPLPKIEHFDVINFPGEAMENYGLLTYDDLGIFYDEKIVSRSRKQYITTLIIHEIAHQWFGNLVTPAWWNELWLKEGFATYMETFACSFIQPSMKLDEQFPIEKISQFIEIDSLPNSHSLSIDSPNQSTIFQLYDSISYYKGATVIRMMSMILGASTFQQGLQMYLTAFSYNSTTRYDLWKYLTIATNYTINIQQIMEGWTRQAGYPFIEVNRIGNKMILKQRPFNLLSTDMSNKNLWWIPFKYFDKTSNQSMNNNEIIWFNSKSMKLRINTSDSDWILTNPDYLSIYRTKYDSNNFQLILNQLMNNPMSIPTSSRAALIDDIFALSRAGLSNISDAYKLLGYLKNESELVPWTMALTAMNQQEILLGEHRILSDVQQYFLELILPIYEQIGWTSLNSSTDWLYALLQPSILSNVCRYGYQKCIDSARDLVHRWNINPIPADLRLTVYCTIIRTGSRSEFHFLWSRLQNESIVSEILNLLEGLSCTQDPSLILWFLDQHLENQSIIRSQDLVSSIVRIARSSRANQIVWNWIRENWLKLRAKWGQSESALRRIIEAVSTRFVTLRQRDELKTFMLLYSDTIFRQFQSSIERINADIEWNRVNIPTIIDFLYSNNKLI